VRGLPWSDAELALLRERYPHVATRIIAAEVGRSSPAVSAKAMALGMRKSAAFLASPASGRVQRGRTHPGMVATQFRAGHVPVNKGLRRPGWAPGRMAQTQFKRGRPASEARNYVPIGTEKYCSLRGVLLRKVTDDPAIVPAARWRPVHVLVWTAAHGPVPPGHIVIFRRGMKTLVADEITLDRLELVSLKENMLRNTVQRLPAPLPELLQLRGKLNAKINRLERREDEKQD